MARRTKDAPGRVTPKGTRPGSTPGGRVSAPSGRYTPPTPQMYQTSPWWVLPLLLTLLVAGALIIILNYLTVLPGGASNIYLLVGLVLITAGFVTATRLR